MNNFCKIQWLLLFILATTGLSQAVDLDGAFQAALVKNETPAIQAEQTQIANEQVKQAWGAVLPSLSFQASYMRQDIPPQDVSAFLVPNQYTTKFNLTQPLFHGLRDVDALKGIKANRRAQISLLKQSRLTLYSGVAQTFYSVLQNEQALHDLNALVDLTQTRVKELRSRVRIGRSRQGELLAALSQLAATTAQVEGARLSVAQARENFRLATGLSSDTTLSDSAALPALSNVTLEHYLDLVEKRPDVEAQKDLWEAANDQVGVAFGSHLPSLDFSANYYPYRNGFQEPMKWDLGVTLVVPLFEGGTVQAQVRQAVDQRKQQELTLSQIRRTAVKDVTTYFKSFQSDLVQVQALQDAVKAADLNYKAQTHDYRYGLVTNLDVLDALNSLEQTKLTYDQTYYNTKITYAALLASVAEVPRAMHP